MITTRTGNSSSNRELSSMDFRNKYSAFYSEMRKYLWDISILEDLADFEVCIYDAFPDMNDLKKTLDKLEKGIKDVMKTDEDLKASFEALKDLSSSSIYYYRLKKVGGLSYED